jgi:hypothetical protein
MGTEERASRSAGLQQAVLARRPHDWLADQLEAAR